jgi:diguanylate cyclase (GGDEF)-like protein
LQKVWVAGGALLLLAMAFVGALYRHLRKINLSLAHNQEFLRAQSQRDPLTGLVNRRALHDRVAALGLERHFAGALLLVDIDHFKHVNDGHGHATGDLVLAELARRLAEVAGDDDLVVRWGGEEFLLFLPGRGPAQVQAMAARILQAVSGSPVDLPEGELRVTASVGFGCFPLAPARLPLSLERAVNLADMALYTAKNQGRNLAIGISEASATSADELHRLEADFDQAWQEGRVSLVRMWGTPAGTDGTPQVAPAETFAAPAPQAVRRASPSSEMPA